MRLTKATHKAVEYACKNFHYAKAAPVCTIGYNVYNDSHEWCGVVLYGTGANPHIGDSYNLPIGGCVELVRVALNGKQESTSQAVAMSLKALKKDCPLIQLVVSYADCDQNHLGTIYQATNWIYTGLNNEGDIAAFIVNGKKTHKKSIHSKMVIINGKKMHCPATLECVRQYIDPNAEVFRTQGKRKYLYPLTKQVRKQILPLAQPYPKTDENWHKIDRSQFKKEKQVESNEVKG